MNIQHLIYITKISKYGSFNKTAKALYITQPALSKAVSNLENELGIKLFNRSNRGVTLTTEGEKFVKFANSIVKKIEDINFEDYQKSYASAIYRLSSVPSSFTAEAFTKFCIFYEHETSFRFTVSLLETSKVIENVANGVSELGIIFLGELHLGLRKATLAAKGLKYAQLGTSRLKILISKDDPLSKKPSVVVDDLKEYSFVHLFPRDIENYDYLFLDNFDLLNDASHKKAVLVNDRNIAYKLLSTTKSFSFAYNHHLSAANIYNLTCVPLEPQLNSELGYIYSAKDELSPFSLKFLEIYRQELLLNGISKN